MLLGCWILCSLLITAYILAAPSKADNRRLQPAGHPSTRMLANAQRDGCPAEYRWRPPFNAAKFGWRPLLEGRAVTLPRCETHWDLQGCLELANRSQPLVGQSSPYYHDIWRRYSCLTRSFPVVDICRSSEDIARQSCATVPKWRFLHPVFSASCMQHISDMHSKFAPRSHHVWKYGKHPISDCWD